MNIAFRTDSSFTIGTGHVHRCLNLAREFKKKNIKCYFFTNEYPGNINILIKNEFDLVRLSTKYSKDFYSKKQNIIDSKSSIKLIKKLKIDLIFLDNYLINENWEKNVSKFCKIVFLSDFINRKSFCNYYLNYNTPYENNYISRNLLNPKCKKLIGANYSIIKDLPNLKKKKIEKKITIFMGGVDSKNFTSRLINILSDKLFFKFEKIIVIGVKNKRVNIIANQIKNLRNFKIVIGNKKNLYSSFANSKLVITSVGTSMYEHFALGLNSIVIAQNKLQKKVISSLSVLNLINFVYDKRHINKDYIYKILNQKNLVEKKKILQNLFNTKGTRRIVNYFISQKLYKNVKLENASHKDKFFMFQLVNDPQVIKNSLGGKITTFKEHNQWFKKIINKKSSKILIFKTINHKLGQVRLDRVSKNKSFITYSIANEFRGQNMGYQMLNRALKNSFFKTPLYAVVRKNNEASNKIFIKLGFVILKNYQKNYFIYYLKNN
jgi:UDP-2,4-diacetamido-2,4,6-trideoxy-beta-L-altropyranose hydrolase